jgi:OMF family outer membrane factor
MKRHVILLLTLILAISAVAQQQLTLQQCVDIARKNNKTLQSAREEVSKYRQDYNNVRGNLLPQVSFDAGYQYTKTWMPDSAIMPFTFSGMLDSTATDFDTTVAGTLDAMMPSETSEEHAASAVVSLNQVIFQGGTLINGINIAGKLYTLQKKKYYLEEQDVIFSTHDLYYQTKLAAEVAAIQQEALHFAQLYQKQVQQMFDQGLVSEYDLLRAKLEVKKLEPQVTEAEKNARLARQSFANFLNISDDSFELIDDIAMPRMQEITLQSAVDEALQNRMELELSSIGVDVNRVLLRNEKGNYLPHIGLQASYGYAGQDAEAIESDDWAHYYKVGVGFSMPLFTGFSNTAKIKKARHTLRQSEINHQDLTEKIELDVRNSYLQWEADMQAVAAQTDNVALAAKGLQIAQARYDNQVSNQLEVIDAQLQLKSAKLSYMNAKYAATISYEKLKKAMGQTL